MKSMLQKLILGLSVLGLVATLTACGKGHPIRNMESQPVPSNIKTAEQVKKAIRTAGAGLGWIISDDGKGKLKGTLNLRTHQAVISIPYSAKEYSLIYQSSVDLNYNPEKGTIHKNYNSWIQNLNNRIQVQLIGL
ncbi:MAG: hypothetical protein AB7C96_05960 [Hydrogenovibrio sp.]